MFELNETLELNDTTLTWVDRTYRTERGLRRFLATLTEAQLAEAEVLVDDDSFVVFYPVEVAARKNTPDSAFHFDLTLTEQGQPQAGRSQELKVGVAQEAEAECASKATEREIAFNILLAGVRL